MAMLQAEKLKIAKNLRMTINNAVPVVSAFPQVIAHTDLPDDEALNYKDLYPEWEPYQKYKTDEILRHNDELYRVIANVNKNSDVEHNGTLWQSVKNNNLDEPGTSDKWVEYVPSGEGGE